jgi:SAM-dependent methyltransferase
MNAPFRRRKQCGLCEANEARLREVLRLAPTPPANEFVSQAAVGKPQDTIPLTLLLCETCGHLQLAEIVDPERLFRNYVYVSGTSPVFVEHFRRYAAETISRFQLGKDSLVVEVGSNDGTLLKQYQAQGVPNVLGIDPASEIVKAAQAAGVPTIEAFFGPELAERLRAERGPAALICANNVFAHTESLVGFARGVRTLLADQGVFVFEVSYLVDVVEKLLFDTIYHEHLAYHAVAPLVRFFDKLGMRLFDAERVDTHGGSVRCYVSLSSASHATSERLGLLLELEKKIGVFSPDTYAVYQRRIDERGKLLREKLSALRAEGKHIAGFGAPAKLTGLMYAFGIDGKSIDFIVDDSKWKQGLFTPGTHIPVVSSSALYERNPDWCVIFAWNFADAIIAKHSAYTQKGGHFIVPLPELREV